MSRFLRVPREAALFLVGCALVLLWSGIAPVSDVYVPIFPGPLLQVVEHSLPTLIVALGMSLVIGLGGIDLSVGATMALCATVAASTLAAGISAVLALPLALLLGASLGAVNGIAVKALRLEPLVATLVMMVAGRGAAQLVSHGQILEVRDQVWLGLATESVLLVPLPVLLAALLVGAFGLTLGGTRIGVALACLGDNPRAARLLGIPVTGAIVAAYAFCGCLAAGAGLLESAWNRAADADKCGLLIELDAILAVVVGGTPLRGGRVRVVGTVFGVLLVEILATTMAAGNVSRELALCSKAVLVLLVAALSREEVT